MVSAETFSTAGRCRVPQGRPDDPGPPRRARGAVPRVRVLGAGPGPPGTGRGAGRGERGLDVDGAPGLGLVRTRGHGRRAAGRLRALRAAGVLPGRRRLPDRARIDRRRPAVRPVRRAERPWRWAGPDARPGDGRT